MKATKNPSYQPTEIDNLFFELYGVYPAQRGKSFEMLVGAVVKILNKDKIVKIDERKKGQYDANFYQIDCSLYEAGNSIMIEAKDLTNSGENVSRPHLDKVAGSLIELEFDSAEVFTSTGFKQEAVNKSLGSFLNPNGKKIALSVLKIPSDNELEGRLENIHVSIKMARIDRNQINFLIQPSIEAFTFLSDKGIKSMRTVGDINLGNSSVEYRSKLIDQNNEEIGRFNFSKTLTERIIPNDNNIATGIWEIDDYYLEVESQQLELVKVKYEIGFIFATREFEIKSTGKSVLLIISDDREINKTITDHELKGITFAEGGEVLFDGRSS